MTRFFAVFLVALVTFGPIALAQTDAPEVAPPSAHQDMTVERLDELIRGLDENVERQGERAIWVLNIEDVRVQVIADAKNDRMRIIVPIAKVDAFPPAVIFRMMQANFDTALDARYAIAQGIVWTAFIHPLKALRDRQFVSGISQTVTLAKTTGSTYTSGGPSFGGGDSQGLLKKKLLDQLREQGMPI